jgi:hypothetical protein
MENFLEKITKYNKIHEIQEVRLYFTLFYLLFYCATNNLIVMHILRRT